MIVVKTMYNTDANGESVPDDIPDVERPTVYHGPFKSIDKARIWMEDVYPDDDMEVWDQLVVIIEGDFPNEWLNSPDALYTIGAQH